jgi:hypothetical protein
MNVKELTIAGYLYLPYIYIYIYSYRYLQESGFVHSAFTFVYESMLGKSNIRNADKSIPPGALITFLQKGLQYVGIEESLNRGGSKARKVGANDVPSLSLLSPPTIAALTRENPPIQLNVPPATAAAAVKARLEAEAKIEEDRKAHAVKEATDAAHQNGSSKITGPSSIPPQPQVEDPNHLARTFTAMAAQAQLSASAAPATSQMNQSQMQQSNSNVNVNVNANVVRHKPVESAGAAALTAQHRRVAAAEIAAQRQQLEIHQKTQHLHQQLQLQQQLQQEQQQQLQLHKMQQQQQQQLGDGINASATVQAAATLASVSLAGAGTPAGTLPLPLSGNKRTAGKTIKEPKRKGKAAKQARQASPPAGSGSESLNLISQAANSNSGLSSLEEAVARIEAQKANGVAEKVSSSANASTSNAIPMDVEENDEQARSSEMPAHTGLGSTPLLPQDLVNGKYPQGRRPLNGGPKTKPPTDVFTTGVRALTRDIANVPVAPQQRAGPQQPGNAPLTSSSQTSSNPQENQHPKKVKVEQRNNDSVIDREDELTNASLSEVLELKMHSSEVFMCAWNPVFTDMIATGSGDASARIWQLGGKTAVEGTGPVRLLPHGTGPRDRKNKDVTTLEWSSDGKLLATGSYDGVARVWSRNGALVHTLRGHKGPIFSLKWNKRGNYLLSGSYDKTTIVWDVSGSTGFVEQQFNDHQAPALDVDWKDDTTFASCSTDKTVHICRVGVPRPLKTYTGHTDEVNAVKWDPSGTLLASCSDDCTAKVWDVGSDRKDPMQDFKSHQQEIYTVKW